MKTFSNKALDIKTTKKEKLTIVLIQLLQKELSVTLPVMDL